MYEDKAYMKAHPGFYAYVSIAFIQQTPTQQPSADVCAARKRASK